MVVYKKSPFDSKISDIRQLFKLLTRDLYFVVGNYFVIESKLTIPYNTYTSLDDVITEVIGLFDKKTLYPTAIIVVVTKNFTNDVIASMTLKFFFLIDNDTKAIKNIEMFNRFSSKLNLFRISFHDIKMSETKDKIFESFR